MSLVLGRSIAWARFTVRASRVLHRELLGRVELRPLRLLGVQVARLEDVRQPVQEVLFLGADADASTRKDFVEAADKLARVTPSLDKLRRRFGRGAVLPASLLGTATPEGRDGTPGEGAQEPEA